MAAPMLAAATVVINEIFLDDDDENSNILCILAYAYMSMSERKDRNKCENFYEVTVPRFLPDTFKRFFRMDSSTVEILCRHIAEYPELATRQFPGGREQIPLEKKVLMTLRYLGSQETVLEISNLFGVTEYSFINSRRSVISAINRLQKRFIRWPNNAECANIAREFDNMGNYSFPDTVGAIDGSHIPIAAPRDNPQAYFNRKKFHSVILQAVCTHELLITDICVGWPGRVHDAKVFRNSNLWDCGFQNCQNGLYHLIGDCAYPIKRWLMTPYRDNGHLSRRQIFFNNSLSSKRQVIERAFGMLKGRFRRLNFINIIDIKEICDIVLSAVILHNICCLESDNFEEVLQQGEVNDEIPPPLAVVPNEAEGFLKRIHITNNL